MKKRLLILTQKVDKDDPVLGFFHTWITEFSKHCESIVVICLYKRKYDLPDNVRVLSLGKEVRESKFSYIKNFYSYVWNERKNYDTVFVHMNQEYVLLGWKVWKLLGKDIYMWRNHHSGSILTDLAVFFCKKVFCTSQFSYTNKFKKTVIMPVGVDLNTFKINQAVSRIPNSVLSLGRIAPSKKIHILINEIEKINDPELIVNIYGDTLPIDQTYSDGLKQSKANFHKGIPNIQTVDIYSAHEIFVNLSSNGMYDKTIFEAIACGCLILASNDNLRGHIQDDFIFKQEDGEELRKKLLNILSFSTDRKKTASLQLMRFAQQHSLENLADKLFKII